MYQKCFKELNRAHLALEEQKAISFRSFSVSGAISALLLCLDQEHIFMINVVIAVLSVILGRSQRRRATIVCSISMVVCRLWPESLFSLRSSICKNAGQQGTEDQNSCSGVGCSKANEWWEGGPKITSQNTKTLTAIEEVEVHCNCCNELFNFEFKVSWQR